MTKPIYETTKEMFNQLEFCGYECEAGVMTMNEAYNQLKERVELMEQTLAWYGDYGNYSKNTALHGHDVIADDGKLARIALGRE